MLSLLDSSGGRAPLFHVEVFARFEPLDLDDRVEIEGLVVRNGERDLERGRSRDRFLWTRGVVRFFVGSGGWGQSVRERERERDGAKSELVVGGHINSRRDGSLVQ